MPEKVKCESFVGILIQLHARKTFRILVSQSERTELKFIYGSFH